MPVDVALNIALRNIVRRDLSPIVEVLPELGDDIEQDTDEEAQDRFRAAGVFPTKRAAAQAARAAEQQAAEQLRPRPGGILAFSGTTAVAGSSFLASVVGPVPLFPFLIDSLQVNLISAAGAAGGTQSNVFALLISSTNDLSLGQLQADTPVIIAGDQFSDGIAFARLRTSGQSSETVHVPISYAVPLSPAFVKFLTVPAANTTMAATASITQLAGLVGVTGTPFVPPVGRTTININTAAPRPRTRRAPTPRAAVISVTQGGRILNQRTVAWESLAGPIRADWFNRQVGGVGDPSIRWVP